MIQPLSVSVCACTYLRPGGLHALLQGLAAQTLDGTQRVLGSLPQVSIVIADNEGNARVRNLCETFAEEGPWPLAYVHEPRRGISFARNACLENLPSQCDFFAFIDDDEVPASDWLDQLLLAQAATSADVVQGRVIPRFAEDAPRWIACTGFFQKPDRYRDPLSGLQDFPDLSRATTDNVLVRTSAVRQLNLWFDPAFALCGGEDTLFFRSMRAKGKRIIYAEKATVHETVPPARATFRYMFIERFRIANVNTLVEDAISRTSPPSRRALLIEGFRRILAGFRRELKCVLSGQWRADSFAKGAFLVADGLGVIAVGVGFKYKHYK